MRGASERRPLALWVIYSFLIIYASLYPFTPWRAPEDRAIELFFSIPRYYTLFDIWINVLAYVPLGVLGYLVFAEDHSRMSAVMRAVAGAALLSLLMEAAQLVIARRVASIADFGSNTLGALLGAVLLANPLGEVVRQWLAGLRERYVIRGMAGDLGIALLAIWLLAQWNPAIPLFDAGNITNDGANVLAAQDPLAGLQLIGIALNVCAFGLFLTLLFREGAGVLKAAMALIALAIGAKLVSGLVMLKPAFALESLNTLSIAGLVFGFMVLLPLCRLGMRARAYLGVLFMLAGTLLSKAASIYDALSDLLKLFDWPHGQLSSFASLTRYLSEGWPLLALIWMIWAYLRPPRGQ